MERLGRYELLEELGRGAMGVVYKARDPQLHRLVAIKVLLPVERARIPETEQRRERFRREARAAGTLAHSNIVAVHDVGEEAGREFLVMEFIEGQSLDDLLRERRSLPLDQVAVLIEQVAQALDCAHRHGIVHRDIKPANILLSNEGVYKVADFGIARISGATLTQPGHILGTPCYMSPEQIAGLKVDGRSDTFSLGAVLYELLSGEKAFPGETLSTIMYRILHEDPTPLRRLNPAYPAGLDACLKKALAKDPARRYARPTDLARDLCAAVQGRPALAERPTVTGAVAGPARRPSPPPQPRSMPRWIRGGVGSLAVAAILLALVVWLRPFPPRHKPAHSPAPAVPQASADEEAARRRTAEAEAQRKAEAERLAAERQRIEAEKARLAGEKTALEAAQRKAAEEAARSKAVAEPPPGRQAQPERRMDSSQGARTPRMLVNTIRFEGNTAIPTSELEELVRDRLGEPASPEELSALIERVNQHYDSRGYFLARVQPRAVDFPSGVFEIEVAEGRVGRLRVEGFSGRQAQLVERAFAPLIQKGVVEKGMLRSIIRILAERHSLPVRFGITPGNAPGAFDLVVQASRSGRIEVDIPDQSPPRFLPSKARERPGG